VAVAPAPHPVQSCCGTLVAERPARAVRNGAAHPLSGTDAFDEVFFVVLGTRPRPAVQTDDWSSRAGHQAPPAGRTLARSIHAKLPSLSRTLPIRVPFSRTHASRPPAGRQASTATGGETWRTLSADRAPCASYCNSRSAACALASSRVRPAPQCPFIALSQPVHSSSPSPGRTLKRPTMHHSVPLIETLFYLARTRRAWLRRAREPELPVPDEIVLWHGAQLFASSALTLMPLSMRRSMAKSPNSIKTRLKTASRGVFHR
jgi:hypothetical protein